MGQSVVQQKSMQRNQQISKSANHCTSSNHQRTRVYFIPRMYAGKAIVAPDLQQMFKVKRSKVKVTA